MYAQPANRIQILPTVGLIVLILVTAGFSALMVVFGGPILTALFAITCLGLFFALSPNLMLWTVILGSLIFVGVAQLYYPPLSLIRWLLPFATAALLIHVFSNSVARRPSERGSIPALLWWAIAFMLIGVVSTLINWQSALNAIQGVKLYFSIWGLLFGLVLLNWKPESLDRIPRFFFWLAVLQLPFVLHQFFYLAPAREHLWVYGVVPLDVVAGTFGAAMEGGGKNSGLGAFLVITLGLILQMWKDKVASLSKLVVALPFIMIPLLLNESKISVFLMLMVFVLIFRDDIFHNPVRFLLASLFLLMLSYSLLFAYAETYGHGKITPIESIEKAIDRNVGHAGHGSLQLNRVTVLSHWASEHFPKDIPGALIGHGLGASHESTEGVLDVSNLTKSRYHGKGIGLTGISALLWDTGIFGLSCIFGMLAASYVTAGRLCRNHYMRNRWRSSLFKGYQSVIFVFGVMLFHNNHFVLDITFQTLVLLVIGHIGYWGFREQRKQVRAVFTQN
jgi:hypothetical protein